MKRRLMSLLAALMLLSCLTPAFASDLFEEFGDIDSWTDEQWAASQNWTDEQWEEYWASYDIWYEEVWWREYISGVKSELGMPYPNGINVCLEGTYLTFVDGEPTAIAGRTMVPFRGLLEEMGAQVEDDQGQITAVFPEGKTLQMELGSRELALSDGTQEETVEMDVAPWKDEGSGQIYLPVRFVAQALGLGVYWDSTYEVVYLVDWASYQTQVDSRFTVFNQILAAAWKAADQDKTYLSKDHLSLSGTLYGEKENDTAAISLKGESLTRGYQYQGSYQLHIDLGGLEDTLFSVLTEKQRDFLDQLDGSQYQLMMDLEQGELYFRGDRMDQLSGQMLPSDQWIHAASAEMAALTGFYERQDPPTMGSLIADRMKSYYEMGLFDADGEGTVAVWDLLLGDDNFKTSKVGNATTYTADMSLLSLFRRAVDLGILEDTDLLDLLFGEGQTPTGQYQITATVEGEKLSSLALTGNVRFPGAAPFEVEFSITGDSGNTQVLFAFRGDYVGKLELEASSEVATTSRMVQTAPGEGEEVAELEDLLETDRERQYSQDEWNSDALYSAYDNLAAVFPF